MHKLFSGLSGWTIAVAIIAALAFGFCGLLLVDFLEGLNLSQTPPTSLDQAPDMAKKGTSSAAAPLAEQQQAPSPSLPNNSARADSGRDPRYWPKGYFSGDPLPPSTIYLTFDDGPTQFTPAILDILKEEGVHATFFICGQAPIAKKKTGAAPNGQSQAGTATGADGAPANYLLQYSATIRRMVREGHVIGNHSYSHIDLGAQSAKRIDFEISTVDSQLRSILGTEMPAIRFIRPPFGSPWLGSWNSSKQREKACRALGPKGIIVLWTEGLDSGDSEDWANGEWFTPETQRYHPDTESYAEKMNRLMKRLLRKADGIQGGIVLMHDSHPTSRDILKALIIEYKRRGYRFGTLEDYAQWRWNGQ